MKIMISQQGYIALISAILISTSLLILTISVSFEGFYSRFMVSGSEQKEISTYLAKSCVNTAILKIAQDRNYLTKSMEIITVGDTTCHIISIETGNIFVSNRLIKAQGRSGQAYTNLVVEIDPSVLPHIAIKTWDELPSF